MSAITFLTLFVLYVIGTWCAEYVACFYLVNGWPLLHLKFASMCDEDLEREEDRHF